jgi:thioredoxin 1
MNELDKIREKKLKEMEQKYIGKKEIIYKPIIVTDQTFEDTIKKSPVVVVDFWAQWCTPCQMFAPIIEELARDYAGKVLFGKADVDDAQETTLKLGIMTIPTLVFFKNGKLVDQVIGTIPKEALEERIRRVLAHNPAGALSLSSKFVKQPKKGC